MSVGPIDPSKSQPSHPNNPKEIATNLRQSLLNFHQSIGSLSNQPQKIDSREFLEKLAHDIQALHNRAKQAAGG